MGRFLPLVLACVAGAAGCNRNAEPTPIPTPVAPATITENYTGTLYQLGSNLHSFQVQASGEVYVTLTAVNTVPVDADPSTDPPTAAVPSTPVTEKLTLNVGQPTLTTLGVQCSHIKSVETASGTTPQLTGQALIGTFCVSLSDSLATLPRTSTYAITVSHS